MAARPLLKGTMEYQREPSALQGSDENVDGEEDPQFKVIIDRFERLTDVTTEMKKGLDKCGLIFGIDFTLSNCIQGKKSFGGRSLHDVSEPNPYQEVICILGETLEPFDDDGIIPAYGFGDSNVRDKGVFPLKPEGQCVGFGKVLDAYNEIIKTINFGGPTNFAPLIKEAINIVKTKKLYHILVIVADGQVNEEEETVKAIVEASEYPLSIIMIGVGDGPWKVMKEFDDKLPERKFDNFQFVNFHEIKDSARNPQASIALGALMEIPDQCKAIKELHLLEKL